MTDLNCPLCSERVPDDAATCPGCGHDLGEVVVGGTETAPRRATVSRPSWLVFGGVAVAVLAIGAVAFAFFAGSPVGAAAYADRIPADAVAYVEIDVQRLLSDESQGLVEAFAPAIESETGEQFDMDAAMQDALDSFDEQIVGADISFSEDIASWATGPVGVALFGGSGETGERVALLVGGDDSGALDAFLSKVAAAPDTEVTGTTQVAGVDFHVFESGDQRGLIGRSGSDLVAASDESLAETLVTGEGDTLDDDEAFMTRVESLPASPAVIFAVDGDAVAEGMAGAQEELGGIVPELGGMGLLGGQIPAGWTVGAVTIESQVLRVDTISATGASLPPPTYDESLTSAFPAETIAFARVGSLFDQLSILLESAMFAGMADEVESELGVGLDDILAVFSVDGAIGVWPSSDPELPVNAALVGVSDENQSELVDRLAELAPMMGLVPTPTENGYSVAGLVHAGTRDTYTFVSTDADLIAGAPAESFADGDLAARASELVDGELQLAVDIPAVIDLVDGLVAADDPESARQLACLPLGVAASGVDVGDETISTSFALEVVAPDDC